MKLSKKLLLPLSLLKKSSLVMGVLLLLFFLAAPFRHLVSAQNVTGNATDSNNPPPAFNGEGFTIAPADPNAINSRKFIFELKPGDTVEDYVLVKNLSQEKGNNFYLYGADPTFSSQGTPAYKTRDVSGEGEGKWLSFEEPSIYLEPLEEKKIKFTLHAPSDAPYGDYRIGVAMEKTQKDSTHSAINIATRVILHAEIKLTDNPTVIAKLGDNASNSNGSSAVSSGNNPWHSFYFWVSLVLFVMSLIVLMWITWQERKVKSLAVSKAGRASRIFSKTRTASMASSKARAASMLSTKDVAASKTSARSMTTSKKSSATISKNSGKKIRGREEQKASRATLKTVKKKQSKNNNSKVSNKAATKATSKNVAKSAKVSKSTSIASGLKTAKSRAQTGSSKSQSKAASSVPKAAKSSSSKKSAGRGKV